MNEATVGLEALHDIHLPEAVTFWPPAPGWWIALAIALLATAALLGVRYLRRISVRHAALCELAGMEQSFGKEGDVEALAIGVSRLLRRVALARHPRSEVALIHGPEWFDFLAISSRKRPFPTRAAASLERVVYGGRAKDIARGEPATWVAAARRWIEDNT